MHADAVLSRDEIRGRLLAIFPEGTPHRGYCTRELAWISTEADSPNI